MKYQGGKVRRAPAIVRTLRLFIGDSYYEPFAGSGAVAVELRRSGYEGKITLSDLDAEQMALLEAIGQGWQPPEFVTKEQYRTMQLGAQGRGPIVGATHERGYVGCLGWCGQRWESPTDGQNATWGQVQSQQRNALQRDRPQYATFSYLTGSYYSRDLSGYSFVYCDPPYEYSQKPSHRYQVNTKRNFGPFNPNIFFEWASELSQRTCVAVSEQAAPPGWIVIDSSEQSRKGNRYKGVSNPKRIDNLYTHRDGVLAKRMGIA